MRNGFIFQNLVESNVWFVHRIVGVALEHRVSKWFTRTVWVGVLHSTDFC